MYRVYRSLIIVRYILPINVLTAPLETVQTPQVAFPAVEMVRPLLPDPTLLNTSTLAISHKRKQTAKTYCSQTTYSPTNPTDSAHLSATTGRSITH
jgi:hypothetical protein